MLDESILSFQGCQVFFVTFILFLMENSVSKQVDPVQTHHYVASDLGLHCLPMIIIQVPR